MKRVLLAALLFAPLSVWAETAAQDPFTQGSAEAGVITSYSIHYTKLYEMNESGTKTATSTSVVATTANPIS